MSYANSRLISLLPNCAASRSPQNSCSNFYSCSSLAQLQRGNFDRKHLGGSTSRNFQVEIGAIATRFFRREWIESQSVHHFLKGRPRKSLSSVELRKLFKNHPDSLGLCT
jgi:hypothetical protein